LEWKKYGGNEEPKVKVLHSSAMTAGMVMSGVVDSSTSVKDIPWRYVGSSSGSIHSQRWMSRRLPLRLDYGGLTGPEDTLSLLAMDSFPSGLRRHIRLDRFQLARMEGVRVSPA